MIRPTDAQWQEWKANGVLVLPTSATAVSTILLIALGAQPAAALECSRDNGQPQVCVDAGDSCLCTFENLAEGQVLASENFPPSMTLHVDNNHVSHPDEAIVFDSACGGGCTGNDDGLQTPNTGPGNTVALGNLMIIAQDLDGVGGDGLVDDPNDEHDGGVITLTFARPYKVFSLRVVDIEATETPSHIELDLTAGGTQVVNTLGLGDSSQQLIVIPEPASADELRIVHNGT